MPGIAGVLAPSPSPVFEQHVRQMVATMWHQPDSETGTVFAPELGVYGGWVAHAGSFAARQSMLRDGTSTSLLFAGECFGLAGTLPDLYAVQGERLLASLNGLFSGLIVDRARRQTLLFNDRFGSERLHTCESNGAIYFASEAKALLTVLPAHRELDNAGVAQFLTFGSTINGHTLFRGVNLLPGGSAWRFSPGAPLQRSRYFVPADWEVLPLLTVEEFWDCR
jgi:asparagine synthase (glutamine-hydrolysing)